MMFPENIKLKRLQEVIDLQLQHSAEKVKAGVGKVHKVLVEQFSKKSADMLSGRNSQNTVVVFPKGNFKKGDFVNVLATKCTGGTLIGEAV
jgi:tRNA-2-methylthio-N6-dimethylallyladenosine synthase